MKELLQNMSVVPFDDFHSQTFLFCCLWSDQAMCNLCLYVFWHNLEAKPAAFHSTEPLGHPAGERLNGSTSSWWDETSEPFLAPASATMCWLSWRGRESRQTGSRRPPASRGPARRPAWVGSGTRPGQCQQAAEQNWGKRNEMKRFHTGRIIPILFCCCC